MSSESYSQQPVRRLQKDNSNRILNGVAAGLAEYFHLDVSIVRFFFIVLTFFNLISVFLYCAFVVFFPSDLEELDDTDPVDSVTNHLAIAASILVICGATIVLFIIDIPIFIPLWSLSFLASLAIIALSLGLFCAYLIYTKNTVDFERDKFVRSNSNKVVSGVIGGLSEQLFIDPTVLRAAIVCIILVFIKILPLAILTYIICSLFTHEDLD